MRRVIFFSVVLIVIFAVLPLSSFAHSGNTDSRGGHYNRSTGEYHYHHGHSAHSHNDSDGDGDLDCPYTFSDQFTSFIDDHPVLYIIVELVISWAAFFAFVSGLTDNNNRHILLGVVLGVVAFLLMLLR